MAERLQKILSQLGVASRRQAEQWIQQGRVTINGRVAEIGQQADLKRDRIHLDGKRLRPKHRPEARYLLLHKPVGVVPPCRDPQRRRTVIDLVDPEFRPGLHPVGRLDTDSSGLLLLCNDGELTYQISHPRFHIEKTYRVWVEGHPPASVLEHWRSGVWLDDYQTLPAGVRILHDRAESTLLEVILHEGRNRQIRRVAEQLGHPVLRLTRVAIGPLRLGSLQPGEYRSLTAAEVYRLRQLAQGT